MVLVEEIKDEPASAPTRSDERLLDVEEIEKVAQELKRPGARLQLESLAKKLRKEAAALKRVEKNQASTTTTTAAAEPVEPKSTPVPAPPKTVEAAPLPPPSTASSVKYTTVDRFSFDPGQYNDKFVSIYVPLPGVGSISKDKITCQFTKDSFDLIANDLPNGKSYRLCKDKLEKDIHVGKSKYLVKADKIVLKLCKIKGEYGSFDMWTKLTDPKKKEKAKTSKDNPMSSITDLMKDMYESGDDQMKKMIGETMMKQRNGELGKEDTKLDGGFGDFGDDI